MERFDAIVSNLDLSKPGLEIAPYYNPVVLKSPTTQIYYTDYVSNEEIEVKAAANPGMAHRAPVKIDFQWKPGSNLADCAPAGVEFAFAVSSHVIEHVPDTLGWVNQIMSVLSVGGIFSIVIPDRRSSMDYYRSETTAAQLIDAWLRKETIPTTAQIVDFLSLSVDDSGPVGTRPFDPGVKFEDCKRYYTHIDVMNFATHAWTNKAYIDIHCTVWTPTSFLKAFEYCILVGILNVEISEVIQRDNEFIVQLKKLGEPLRLP